MASTWGPAQGITSGDKSDSWLTRARAEKIRRENRTDDTPRISSDSRVSLSLGPP